MGEGPWGTSARTPSLSLTPPPPPPSAPCSYTRDRPLFLQLKDYFWVRTPSLYELPYGIKGSGEPPPPRARGGRLSVCPWVSASLFVAPTKVGAHLMDPQVWSVGG